MPGIVKRSGLELGSPFRYFKTSPEIIQFAVMMYIRFVLSLRNVGDLLHERGIDVCHESIGRLRDECLNETLFTSLVQARAVLASWRDDYNRIRPHSSLGGATPIEARQKAIAQALPAHAPAELVTTAQQGHQQRGGLRF